MLLVGISMHTYGQVWLSDTTMKASYVDYCFYSNVCTVLVGAQAKTFVITTHRQDDYWDNPKNDYSQLLVSNINGFNISFVKKLEQYADDPLVKFYNNTYYIYDRSIKLRKKKIFYNLHVYNADWSYNKTIELYQLPNQSGFIDFVIDKSEHIYMVSTPYTINYKARGFVGNYVLKIDSNGKFVKKTLFKNCKPIQCSIINDTLLLLLSKQAKKQNFLNNDSVLEVKVDTNLDYTYYTSKKYVPNESKISEEVLLTNGSKVVYIDSIYSLTPLVSTTTFKIALIDTSNNRKWTYEPSNRWHYTIPKPLSNESFITKIDKRWDSTCVVVYNETGETRQIKSFLMNADTRVTRYRILDFYEVNPSEILLFYIKELPSRKQILYFEVIKL